MRHCSIHRSISNYTTKRTSRIRVVATTTASFLSSTHYWNNGSLEIGIRSSSISYDNNNNNYYYSPSLDSSSRRGFYSLSFRNILGVGLTERPFQSVFCKRSSHHHHHSSYTTTSFKGDKSANPHSSNNNNNNNNNTFKMTVHHLTSVDSTQDEARRLLKQRFSSSSSSKTTQSQTTTSPPSSEREKNDYDYYLAVSATEQSKGRGTSGRDWIGRRGNVFVTICIPFDRIIVTPTLLPLKIGCIVAQHVANQIHSSSSFNKEEEKEPKITVKWPNDVLVNNGKIAGILIESEYDVASKKYWHLIGIGVNVAHAPTIEQEGKNRGRHSTCLAHYCLSFPSNEDGGGVEVAKEMAISITNSIYKWVEESLHLKKKKEVASDLIVQEWSSWAVFGKEQVLRDKPGYAPVMPIRVESDGRLRVRRRGGDEVLLCTDYLY